MNTVIEGVSLSAFTARIKKAIDQEFGTELYWVIAEIVQHKFAQDKNHHYQDLIEKDADNKTLARISARAWRKGSESIRNFESYTGQKFHDGIQVLLRVAVEYSQEFGLQLIIHEIDVQYTLGQLQQNKQNILARLVRECSGYIQFADGVYHTRNKALRLPPVIQRIAVITSEQTAGYADFIKKLQTNPYQFRFEIFGYFTVVQGEQNAKGIRDQLIKIFHDHEEKRFDAVVIIRGGGSPMDLLIFNDYVIAQAVAKFPIPIITGIGHQTDETITDLMAHTCKNAPTGAAVFIIEHTKHFADSIQEIQRRITLKSQQILAAKNLSIANAQAFIMQKTAGIIAKQKDALMVAQQTVMERSRRIVSVNKDGLALLNHNVIEGTRKSIAVRKDALSILSASVIARPRVKVGILKGDLANMISNLHTYTKKFFVSQRGYLGHYQDKFTSAKPEKILKMGFAVVTQRGKPVSNPDKITKGEELSVLLADTKINTIVTSKEKTNVREFDL